MTLTTTVRALALASLGAALVTGGADAGLNTTTAYDNFPEDNSGWYATGCCDGAFIADDIETDAGTEGMDLAFVKLQLRVLNGLTPFTLYIYRHDHDTDLPGELLGSKYLGFQWPGDPILNIDVSNMGITIPATRKLWIAIYAPGGSSGWFIAGTNPTVGDSGNFYARDTGDGYYLSMPSEEIPTPNLMLRVEASQNPCPADTNDDLQVGVDDLNEVIVNWGCTEPPGPCNGDVNADGVVDVLDLVQVITDWGPCFDV